MKTAFTVAIAIITFSVGICSTVVAQPLKVIVARKSLPGYDPDAQAFLTAAGITNAALGNALNNLVVNAKAHGWWSLCNAIYPMIGGTATTCKYNLKDPRDLDAAFRLTFNGSPTFASTGVTWGTNKYADTHLVPNTTLSQNSSHFSIWCTTATAPASFGGSAIGGDNSTSPYFEISWDGGATPRIFYALNSILDNGQTPVNRQGLTLVSRGSASTIIYYFNGAQIASTSRTSSTPSTFSIYLGAYHETPGNTVDGFDNGEYAFATIGSNISSTIQSLMYTDIQTFNGALGR